MDCGNDNLTFCPVGSKILYNRKRADESDAAASKQGDTASPEKRGFPVFSGATTAATQFSFVRRNFISFFKETKGTRQRGGSGFLFRERPRPRGCGGRGASGKLWKTPLLFHSFHNGTSRHKRPPFWRGFVKQLNRPMILITGRFLPIVSMLHRTHYTQQCIEVRPYQFGILEFICPSK